jgi:hypothetical protein
VWWWQLWVWVFYYILKRYGVARVQDVCNTAFAAIVLPLFHACCSNPGVVLALVVVVAAGSQ